MEIQEGMKITTTIIITPAMIITITKDIPTKKIIEEN